jgi:hypothetical protein
LSPHTLCEQAIVRTRGMSHLPFDYVVEVPGERWSRAKLQAVLI